MSTPKRLMNAYSARKEFDPHAKLPCYPPHRRPNFAQVPGAPAAARPPAPVYLRQVESQVVQSAGVKAVYEEEPPHDEVLLRNGGQFDDIENFEEDYEPVEEHVPAAKNQGNGLRTLAIGERVYQATPEMLASIEEIIAAGFIGTANLDNRDLDEIIHSNTGAVKYLACGLRASFQMISVLNDKINAKKSAENYSDLMADLVTEKLKDAEPILIENLSENGQIDVIDFLTKLPAIRKTLRQLVNFAGRLWLEKIMSREDRKKYSISTRSRGLMTIPERFIIAPIAPLIASIELKNVTPTEKAVNVTEMFHTYIKNSFNHARSDETNGKKNRKREHKSTEN